MRDSELIRALKALADPTRFRMVQEIAAARELSCGQISEHFHVSQPTISHHLRILVDASILVQRSEGKHHFTSVNQVFLKRVTDLLPARLSPVAKREPRKNPQ